MNIIRLTAAVIILGVATILTSGADPASWYTGGRPLLLALSGLIGLALGDSALFKSMLLFGPRRATLVMSCVPIITTAIAWFMIAEALSLKAIIGIVVTVTGVVVVVFEKSPSGSSNSPSQVRTGLLLGVVAAGCQAVGLVLAKAGMAGVVSPLPATLLRMVAGWAGMFVSTFFSIGWKSVFAAFKDPRGMALTGGGVVFGPVLGVWLSLVAVANVEAGVAATLMGIVPIFVILWVRLIHGEKTSIRALIGTVGTVIGASLLFNR